jgi:hypothetical protein
MSTTIPDPALTLSETLNIMGIIGMALHQQSDVVVESAWEKLRLSAAWVAEHHPDEFEAVRAEVDMHKRWRVPNV